MLTDKPESEYTAEEKAAKAEYERKVAELNEEREKFYKQLEAELRKLQQTNVEGEQAFDDTLQQLFNRKVQIETAVFHVSLGLKVFFALFFAIRVSQNWSPRTLLSSKNITFFKPLF